MSTMRMTFTSNHVQGDFSSGRLIVQMQAEVSRAPHQPVTTVWFSVPPDFHTHNDSVAAALMTLVGRSFPAARFNFPISQRCADILAWYYSLTDIGPIDRSLEPRRPGRHIALNFSGGLDSTALWVLLHDLATVPFKVVTTEYQGFALDRPGYLPYHRDVSSETNLRRLKLDRVGRFNCATPLIFADYADLWGVANGHAMNHAPYSIESLADGRRPAFLNQDATYNAGGLAEMHIARGLNEPGLLKILVRAAPERIPAALDGSAFPGDRKRAMKSFMLANLFTSEGLPLPAYLRDFPLPEPGIGRRTRTGVSFRAVWMLKRLGLPSVARVEPAVYDTDLSMLDDLNVEFFERYRTALIDLMPEPLRAPVLRGLHAAGIYPYDERDHADLDLMRGYLEEVGTDVITESLCRPSAPPHGERAHWLGLPTIELSRAGASSGADASP
jgi:hypothetical protein